MGRNKKGTASLYGHECKNDSLASLKNRKATSFEVAFSSLKDVLSEINER